MAFLADDEGNAIGGLIAGRNAVKRTVIFDAYEHGADPTGVLPNDEALKRALDEVVSIPRHVELIIPNVGGIDGKSIYSFAIGLPTSSMPKDFTMTWEDGAIFKGATGIHQNILKLVGGTSAAPGQFKWTFNNPQVDMTLGRYSVKLPVGDQPSFCCPMFVREVYVNGGHYVGGSPGWWLNPQTGGDSAWEPLGVTYFQTRGGLYTGWNDCAFYVGGANEEFPNDDGFEYKIIEPTIVRCNVGAVLKREGRLLSLINPTIHECNVAVGSFEVGMGQQQGAGQRIILQGGIITKCMQPVRVHAGNLFKMNGTTIEDWGRNPSGVLQNNRAAVWLRGTSKGHITGNTFRMTEWTEDNNIGIMTTNYKDLAGDDWTGGKNFGSGNFFEGVSIPVFEACDINPNYFIDNLVYASVDFSNVRENSVFEYQQAGNPRKLKIVGNSSDVGVRYEILTQPF